MNSDTISMIWNTPEIVLNTFPVKKNMVDLATRLRNLMKEKNISINQLERTPGVKTSSVQNIIYGRSRNPGVKTLRAITDALGCEVEDLLNPEDINAPPKLTPTDTDNFNWSLYLDVLKAMEIYSEELEITLSKDKGLLIADEIYQYSQQTGRTQADMNYAKWILQRSLK